MASTYKILGQSAPSANTDTTLYTVPASTQAVVSTINVCNQTNLPVLIRIAIRQAGAALTSSQYILYDVSVPAYDSLPVTIGITLAATDVITVRTNSANVSFSAFGSEIS